MVGGSVDEARVIRCLECGRAIDELVAGSERWGYWRDGSDLNPPSAPRALHVSSRLTLARAHGVLDLHPPTRLGR